MNLNDLKWETKKVRVSDLIQYDKNPRKISESMKRKLIDSLSKFDLVEIPVINTDMTIIAGNQRILALNLLNRSDEIIDVRFPSRKLTTRELKEYVITSNVHVGEFDFEKLDLDFSDIDLSMIGFPVNETIENVKKSNLSTKIEKKLLIEISLKTEVEQENIYNELIERGYECRILTL